MVQNTNLMWFKPNMENHTFVQLALQGSDRSRGSTFLNLNTPINQHADPNSAQ